MQNNDELYNVNFKTEPNLDQEEFFDEDLLTNPKQYEGTFNAQ